MNINNLIEYLKNKEQEEFLFSIKNEVLEYIISMKKKGSSSNVYVTGSFEGLTFSNNHLISLLLLYLDNKLLEWDLDYILNGIELCNIECEEKAEQVINILASSEINMPINKEIVKTCLRYLKGELKSIDYNKQNKKKKYNYHSIFL